MISFFSEDGKRGRKLQDIWLEIDYFWLLLKGGPEMRN